MILDSINWDRKKHKGKIISINNGTIADTEEKKGATETRREEIVMDILKPNRTKKKGIPIGMKFLYLTDKLSCILKCHDKGHLAEALYRVIWISYIELHQDC